MGLYQLNVVVPAGTMTGDAVPVNVSIGNQSANMVTIADFNRFVDSGLRGAGESILLRQTREASVIRADIDRDSRYLP